LQMGYGAAMAWVLLVVIALVTALIFKTSSAWVFYESK
jgi:multiple sugar transport system permease protein